MKKLFILLAVLFSSTLSINAQEIDLRENHEIHFKFDVLTNLDNCEMFKDIESQLEDNRAADNFKYDIYDNANNSKSYRFYVPIYFNGYQEKVDSVRFVFTNHSNEGIKCNESLTIFFPERYTDINKYINLIGKPDLGYAANDGRVGYMYYSNTTRERAFIIFQSKSNNSIHIYFIDKGDSSNYFNSFVMYNLRHSDNQQERIKWKKMKDLQIEFIKGLLD